MILRDTARTALLPLLVTAIAVSAIAGREAGASERAAVSCELESLVRRVALRENPSPDRVCDVLHERPDGTDEVLWDARDDPDHCELRYERFVRRLVARGWTCVRAGGAGDAELAASDAGAPSAEETASCELGGLVRRITLRSSPSPDRVCDVRYEKPDEGDADEVLWAARNDPGYCAPRYERFVRRLVSDGWTCDRAPGADGIRDEAVRVARSDVADPVSRGLPLDPESSGGASADESAAVIRPASEARTARRVLRDWCVTNAGDAVEYAVFHCNCVSDTMAGYGLSRRDARAITAALPPPSQVTDDAIAPDASRSERLNALAMNYGYVVNACR